MQAKTKPEETSEKIDDLDSGNKSKDKDSHKKEGIPLWYYIAPLAMIIFAGPYVYYSLLINRAAVENMREGYRFPRITDFLMSVVGAVVTVYFKYIVPPYFEWIFVDIVKESDDKEY